MAYKKLLKKLKGAGEALGVGQDKEQWEKTKAKRKKAGKWTPGKYAKKAVKQVVKDVKSAAKGSKEYQAAKAKKKEGKTWTKAVKKQKKAGGPNLSTLVKARGMHKKGTAEYAKIQNQINKAYGVKKRHKVAAPKKAAPKKVYSPLHKPKEVTVAPKPAPKKVDPYEPESPVGKKEYEPKPGQKSTMMRNVPKPAPKAPPKGKASYEETSEYITSGDYKRQPKKALGGKVEDYNKGGKVAAGGGESNPYGWPSRDARNGGKG